MDRFFENYHHTRQNSNEIDTDHGEKLTIIYFLAILRTHMSPPYSYYCLFCLVWREICHCYIAINIENNHQIEMLVVDCTGKLFEIWDEDKQQIIKYGFQTIKTKRFEYLRTAAAPEDLHCLMRSLTNKDLLKATAF